MKRQLTLFIFVRQKVFGSASYSGGNLAARKSEPPASAAIAEHVRAANDNTEHARHAARRDSQTRKQTQQCDVRSLSDLAGLELAYKAQQEPQ